MTDKLDAIPGSTGRKIIDGLKDAVAGNFASVTIEGQRWVRADAPTTKPSGEPALVLEWRPGSPPKPWSEEWFIAETTFGDRVALTALPEEYTYDFKTADGTYIKADKIKRWMQFPDSEFIAPEVDRSAATNDVAITAEMVDRAVATRTCLIQGFSFTTHNAIIDYRTDYGLGVTLWSAPATADRKADSSAMNLELERVKMRVVLAAAFAAPTTSPEAPTVKESLTVQSSSLEIPDNSAASYSKIPNNSNCSKSSNGSPEPDAVRVDEHLEEYLQNLPVGRLLIGGEFRNVVRPSYLLVSDRDAILAALSAPVAGAWKEALKPLAELSLWQDTYPDGPDIIADQRLKGYFTPSQVRAARALLPRNDR